MAQCARLRSNSPASRLCTNWYQLLGIATNQSIQHRPAAGADGERVETVVELHDRLAGQMRQVDGGEVELKSMGKIKYNVEWTLPARNRLPS